MEPTLSSYNCILMTKSFLDQLQGLLSTSLSVIYGITEVVINPAQGSISFLNSVSKNNQECTYNANHNIYTAR